jgi:outer membrane protein assembly factor BamA
MSVILAAIIALFAISTSAQIATGIHLAHVRFNGDTRLSGVDLKQCATDLKSQIYGGTDWSSYLAETVRSRCLSDKGYSKAVVTASTRQLPDHRNTHQFAIAFHIDAGSRYRLGGITFKNNRAIGNVKSLRDLFPIKDGEILDRNALANGLENLRYAYAELGYINFTSVPDIRFDDANKLGLLEIDLDEGKQFYVASINVVGADPKVLSDLPLAPGDIYDARLIDLFLQKHLAGASVDGQRIHRQLDEQNGTVALTFDFNTRPE